MDLKYYLASEDTMESLDAIVHPVTGQPLPQTHCSFCGRQARCLLLPCEEDGEVLYNWFSLAPDVEIDKLVLLEGDPENNWVEPDYFYRGCMECLREGRFIVLHSTEAGDIRSSGQLELNEKTQPLDQASVQELSRTPDFISVQQSIWLTHCGDFMGYLGEWGRDDFNQNSRDGNGQALFQSVDQEASMKFSEREEEWDDLRGYGLYLFRCLHCERLRSFSDWD